MRHLLRLHNSGSIYFCLRPCLKNVCKMSQYLVKALVKGAYLTLPELWLAISPINGKTMSIEPKFVSSGMSSMSISMHRPGSLFLLPLIEKLIVKPYPGVLDYVPFRKRLIRLSKNLRIILNEFPSPKLKF